MEDDGPSLVSRLRDGLRLVSTVVQAFAEPTSEYLRSLDAIARDVAEVIPDMCAVLLRSGDNFTFVAIHDGKPGAEARFADVINRPYARKDSVVAAGVISNGPLIEPWLDTWLDTNGFSGQGEPPSPVEQRILTGATGMIVAPLAARGESIGALWVLRHSRDQRPLDELDLEIIIDLANHAALAVSNARLFKQLERAERLRHAEERAVQASSLLDGIVENIPDMLFVKDAERLAFVRFNRAGEDLLGLSRDQILGKTDADLFSPEEAAFFNARDREALSSGLVDIVEEPIHTARGLRWLHTKKVPLLDSAGKPRYLLGISHDITPRKQAIAELSAAKLAAEDANRELESFSYSVAHDLRTPLRAIDGFSQALVEDYGDKLDVEGRRYLTRVREAAQRMAELIDDLLTLSRVTRSELRRDRIDLSALAHTLLAAFQRVEPERQVEISIEPGIVAEADPQLVAIALDNLLGNAWKFTSKRAAARIEVGVTQAHGVSAYFVRDNGAGFDMTYRDKLFGVFQRLHPESEFPGTGIGLATVARIAQRHRGRAWAVGVPGEGATFFFTLVETPDGKVKPHA